MAVVPTTARASYDKLTIANDALIPKLNCQVFARFPPLVVFWQQGASATAGTVRWRGRQPQSSTNFLTLTERADAIELSTRAGTMVWLRMIVIGRLVIGRLAPYAITQISDRNNR
jgi:hypothetical protein